MENIIKQLNNTAINNLNDNKLDESEKIFELILKKSYIENLYFNMGNLYFKKNDLHKSVYYFEKSIEKKELVYKSYFNIALCYDIDSEKAINYIQKLLKIFKKNKKLKIGNSRSDDLSRFYRILAIIYNSQGNFKKTEDFAWNAIKYNKNDLVAYQLLSEIKKASNDSEYYQKIKNILNEKNLNSDQKRILFSILGKAEKELGNYSESFKYYQQSNQLKNLFYLKMFNKIQPNYKEMQNVLFNTKYDEWTKNKANSSDNYPNVVFIVGLPRSGSTLIETILSCNKNTYCIGEYLGMTSTLNENNLDIYFNNLKNHKILVDKQLSNFKCIPFILNNFKNVKIINATRNPLDNILSMFVTDITYAQDYNSSNLETIYNYFIFYKEVIEYWKEKFPNTIYDCHYDDLVNDPEPNIKQLIENVGFEWSENYINFNKSNNMTTSTASSFQIRQPLYKTASKRWVNYKEFLKPIMDKLDKKNIEY
tara:strand:- start:55731 stop:57167 length:1437 start_codon:yes stop_codon:yes gene_type:complete